MVFATDRDVCNGVANLSRTCAGLTVKKRGRRALHCSSPTPCHPKSCQLCSRWRQESLSLLHSSMLIGLIPIVVCVRELLVGGIDVRFHPNSQSFHKVDKFNLSLYRRPLLSCTETLKLRKRRTSLELLTTTRWPRHLESNISRGVHFGPLDHCRTTFQNCQWLSMAVSNLSRLLQSCWTPENSKRCVSRNTFPAAVQNPISWCRRCCFPFHLAICRLEKSGVSDYSGCSSGCSSKNASERISSDCSVRQLSTPQHCDSNNDNENEEQIDDGRKLTGFKCHKSGKATQRTGTKTTGLTDFKEFSPVLVLGASWVFLDLELPRVHDRLFASGSSSIGSQL